MQHRIAALVDLAGDVEPWIPRSGLNRVARATLADGRAVAIKEYAEPDGFSRELAGLRAAAGSRTPIPRVIAADPEAPPLLVIEWMPGAPLPRLRQPARAAGRALRHLHDEAATSGMPRFGSGHPWRAFMFGWLILETKKARARADLAAPQLDAMFAWSFERFKEQLHDRPDTLIHGDIGVDHVLFDPRSRRVVGVIDFETAAVGDPLWDLATLALDLGGSADLARGYGLVDHEVRDLITAYQVVRLLGIVGWKTGRAEDPSSELRRLASTASDITPA